MAAPKSINFANLSIAIDETAHAVTYTFKGDVDETFKQEQVPRVRKAQIVFVLDEIFNFNSCGIREWIFLIKDISKLGDLVFQGCSVTMVDQINMVPDSLGQGTIESFYAPYYCPEHGEINRKINVKQAWNELLNKQAPSFACDHCGTALEFDALEESYFLFADPSGLKNAS